MTGRFAALLIAVVSLVGCGIAGRMTSGEEDSVRRTETIAKGGFSLAYTHPVAPLPYGENALVSLSLRYPADYVPVLILGDRNSEAAIVNGIILSIVRDDPVIQSDGSAATAIRIVLEAFLPGVSTLGQFAVDFSRQGDPEESRVSIEVEALEFTFLGDPSLTELTGESPSPPELAGLIVVPEKRTPVWILPVAIATFLIVAGALFAFLPRRKPLITPADRDRMLSKLKAQFESEYLGSDEQDDLRPAYAALSRAIQWVPHLDGNPEMKAKLITECAEIRFSGRQVTGTEAQERLRALYQIVVEGGET